MDRTFRFTSGFVIFALFLWLLPLGAFIRPSQEKTACGGSRAFHMCSMMSGKAKTEAPSRVSYTSASSVEKTAKSSASGGDDFVMVKAGAVSALSSGAMSGPKSAPHFPVFPDIPVPPPRITALI